MTPQDFIRKWKPVALTERATAQEHFLDLCRLFDHPTPAEDDPVGDHFTFEKGAPKTGGGEGWADVWKKGYFAWEYKKKKRDLDKALEQLTRYAAALENPPLHVACDTHIFRIETRWTNEAPAKYIFDLEDLADPVNLARLRAVFHNPEELRSGRTREKLTKEAADKFQTISNSLQHRNPDREAVAHFVNQLVFCFFADSVKLLPNGLWKKLLQAAERKPQQSKAFLARLFDDMAKGGDFDLEDILEFNGGLFDGRPPLELRHNEIGLLFAAASLDWSLIDPTIFGTLFECFLDPDKRAQIGAHYTDPEKIMKIVEPVVLRPLRAEWAAAKAKIEAIMAPALEAAAGGGRTRGAGAWQTVRGRRVRRPKSSATPSSTGSAPCASSTRPAARAISFISRFRASKTSNGARFSTARRSASAWPCRASGRKFSTASRSTHSPPNSPAPPSGSATSSGALRTPSTITRARCCGSSTRSNAATPC